MAQQVPATESADEGWETTGERLKLLRIRAGLSARQLADQLSVHFTTVARWERDEQVPRGDLVRELAILLKTSADFILRLKATPSKASGKRTSAKRGTSDAAQLPIADALPLGAPFLQTVK